MKEISKTFFITGLGRSGTMFLATILNRSTSYRVVHEWQLPPVWRDGRLKRFPILRFMLARTPLGKFRKGYGEVNSHLRRTVDISGVGCEAFIEKRGVILRDPRDVVASVMNRRRPINKDFKIATKRVLENYNHIVQLLHHPKLKYEEFQFEKFTTNAIYLQSIVDWTGISDVRVMPDDLEKKINVNKSEWFPKWDKWDSNLQSIYKDLERQCVQQPKFHVDKW